MKFISVQPDSNYFIWQVRVMLNNFKKFKIDKDAIILFAHEMGKEVNPEVTKLASETKARIIALPDLRDANTRRYISTIRPHILKKFFQQFGGDMLFGHDIFYHDCDMIFGALPNFKKLLKTPKIYVSDTISYVGARYIKSKSDILFQDMCNIVGVNRFLVEENEDNSGGAQYLIPNSVYLDYEFWDKVEKDCVALYDHMVATSSLYNPHHPIQAWTADMWALLWNFWFEGYKTEVTKELSFSWPTSHVEEWKQHNIFHNAGVTPDRTDLFFKGAFIHNSPFEVSHENVSDIYCSIKYVQEINETAKLLKK
jgi:hypothetical protein